MAKVTVTKDSRKKADMIINNDNGIITFTKDIVVRMDGNDKNPCKAAKMILGKIEAGKDKDGD